MNLQYNLLNSSGSPFENSLSDSAEIGAFEALWLQNNASSKSISQRFKEMPNASHADLIGDADIIKEHADKTLEILKRENIEYSVILRSTYNYPEKLYDADHPISLLYARGNINLLQNSRAIAVIGTRNASEQGIERTKRLVNYLVQENYMIISGLADGIDAVAHKTAIDNGGKTIAVMGVPISRYYPTKNKDLQNEIAKNHLLLSHVPILRSYQQKDLTKLRFFFPERNAIMSALSKASIIVEASDTSGTLIQAKAALKQGRKLLILDSCFQNPQITWPHEYLKKGAIRVKDPEDIINAIDHID